MPAPLPSLLLLVALVAGPAAAQAVAPAAAPAPDAEQAAAVRAEVLGALDAGRREAALAAVGQLVALQPHAPDAWRFAFHVYAGLGLEADADGALSQAIRLAPDAGTAVSLLTERAGWRLSRGRLAAAQSDVAAVRAAARDYAPGLELGVRVGLARGDAAAAAEALAALEAARGGAPVPALRARVRLLQGDVAGASEALGPTPAPGEATRLRREVDGLLLEARTRAVRLALAGLGAALLLALAAAAGVGGVQGVRLARALAARRPGTAVPRWGRAGVGLARAGVWAGLVGLPLAGALGVAWGALLVGRPGAHPALLGALGLLPLPLGAYLWALGGALRTRVAPEADALLLGPAEAPRLLGWLAEVARAHGAPPPARVWLTPDAGLHVVEAGRLLRVVRGAGERLMVVGLARLAGLREDEARAQAALELREATGPALSDARVGRLLAVLLARLRATPLQAVNPLVLGLLAFARAYEAALRAPREAWALERELAVARAEGGAAVASAGAQAVAQGRRYNRLAHVLWPRLWRAGRPLEALDLYALLDAVAPGPGPDAPGVRPARALELLELGPRARAEDGAAAQPALALVDAAAAHARAFTARHAALLTRGFRAVGLPTAGEGDGAHGAAPEPRALCALMAAVEDALEPLRGPGIGDAEAPPARLHVRLEAALAALEAALPPGDALRALVLADVAQVQARAGAPARARETLERAVRAHPLGARYAPLLEVWSRG